MKNYRVKIVPADRPRAALPPPPEKGLSIKLPKKKITPARVHAGGGEIENQDLFISPSERGGGGLPPKQSVGATGGRKRVADPFTETEGIVYGTECRTGGPHEDSFRERQRDGFGHELLDGCRIFLL